MSEGFAAVGTIVASYENIVSVVASIATVLGLLLAWNSMNQTKKAVRATAVMDIYRDSRELAKLLASNKKVHQALTGTLNDQECPAETEWIMRCLLTHYSAIYNMRKSNVLDESVWKLHEKEIIGFAKSSYVKSRIDQAAAYGSEFYRYMKCHSEKP